MTIRAAPGHANPPLARSYLYVPGDQPRFLENARSRGVDAVIIDLEDGVVSARKAVARETAAAWLAHQDHTAGEIWIRIAGADVLPDVELARFPGVTGIILPKASVESIRDLDRALRQHDASPDRPAPLQIIPLIETAAGLESASAMAALPRVLRFGIGRADLLAELGIDAAQVSPADLSALWLRVVVASAAAGIEAPIAPAETMVRQEPGKASRDELLESSTQRFLALGFRARTAIHPNQAAIINKVFTPSAEEILAAEKRVAWFEQALQSGTAVVVDDQGAIVDEAVIRIARQTLRRVR